MSVSATPPIDWSSPKRFWGSLFVIRSHLSAWANVTLALAGPTLVAVLGVQLESNPATLVVHAIGVIAIALNTLGGLTWATLGGGDALPRMGLRQFFLATPGLA